MAQKPECKACDLDCEPIGSFFACPDPGCERYAVPVNERGDTEDEVSNYEEQGDGCGGSYYSSAAMAAARSIGR